MSVKPSRNGEVIRVEEPVTITYNYPTERVLFNQVRDCNPFFHLFESLWMLAGRNDVAPLAYYNSNIGNYSDDGVTFNGAYGYRWRHSAFDPEGCFPGDGVDQLLIIIDHLRANPDSRRVVLQMWNVEDDLLKIDPHQVWKSGPNGETIKQEVPASKDVCCNVVALFEIEDSGSSGADRYLNMTVVNRSNDLVWGALGANVVHFSFLQEYLAAAIGVEVGRYHQITNNLHAYTDRWYPAEWLADETPNLYDGTFPSYQGNFVPLCEHEHIGRFDLELPDFVAMNKDPENVHGLVSWQEPFLNDVAQPMCHAWHMYKQNDMEYALHWANRVTAYDWRFAAVNWMAERKRRRETATTTPQP